MLLWNHSRTRTPSSDKKPTLTIDVFSRTTTEPSRQALSELMKQHSRTISGGSGSYKGRSRANTATSKTSGNSGKSQHSQHCSAHPKNSSEQSSRSHTASRSSTSAADRPESSNRSHFFMTGALKKSPSKISLQSDSMSITSVSSPTRFNSSRIGFRKRDSIKENIGLPSKSMRRCAQVVLITLLTIYRS